jgi:multidrug efflux pump subunit AcrA (membrane-fusion protein)
VSGQLAEILDGLNPGDKVVTTGLEDIRSGSIVAPTTR